MITKCFLVRAKSYLLLLMFNFLNYDPYLLVIACKPTFPAYLQCLLPTDQVFDFEELEYHFEVANRTEDMPSTEKKGII